MDKITIPDGTWANPIIKGTVSGDVPNLCSALSEILTNPCTAALAKTIKKHLKVKNKIEKINVYTSRFRVINQNFQVVGKSLGEVRTGLGSTHSPLPMLLEAKKHVK